MNVLCVSYMCQALCKCHGSCLPGVYTPAVCWWWSGGRPSKSNNHIEKGQAIWRTKGKGISVWGGPEKISTGDN